MASLKVTEVNQIIQSVGLVTTQTNVAVNISMLHLVLEIQQQQQQLVSLQQHKQQLEKHKKELEDLSMWSLFPKFLTKVGDTNSHPWIPPSSIPPPFPQPIGTPMTSISAPINLAQQKKQGGSTRKQERTSSAPISQPVQQHLMQVSFVWKELT